MRLTHLQIESIDMESSEMVRLNVRRAQKQYFEVVTFLR